MINSLCKGLKIHLQSHLNPLTYAKVWKTIKNRIPDIEYTNPNFLVAGSENDTEKKTLLVWATLEPLKMQVQIFVDLSIPMVEVGIKYTHALKD